MRKLLFILLLAFCLCSCDEMMTDSEGVVQMVKYNDGGDSDKYYYHVYVSGGSKNGLGYHLYTNTKYSVGDKIVIK